MSTTTHKSPTSLPPISDILRASGTIDPYHAKDYTPKYSQREYSPQDPQYSQYPQQYGTYKAAPVLPAAIYSSTYQLSSPDYGATRFYNPYSTPSYSFAGETRYGNAPHANPVNPAIRQARGSWGSIVDPSHQLPSPVHYSTRDFPKDQREMYSRGREYSVSSVEATPAPMEQSDRRVSLSPKSHPHKIDAPSTKGRTRNNLPKEVTQVLLQWLNEHLNHPYPNSFEKAQLIMATGLNQQQLSNWFINARRRKIKFLREKQTTA